MTPKHFPGNRCEIEPRKVAWHNFPSVNSFPAEEVVPRVLLFSILQSQFIEKGFKKNENFEHDAVLLLFLFTLGSVIFKEVSQK